MDKKITALGFTASNKTIIYKILSAILNLGNIQFEETKNDEGCLIRIESRDFLRTAATMLNINESDLEGALTRRIRIARNESIE